MEQAPNKNQGSSGSLTVKAAFAVLATALVLLYIGGVASQQLQPGASSVIPQGQETLFEIEETMTAYSDLRSHEVAYLIEGDAQTLPAINDAISRLNEHSEKLLKLTAGNPSKDAFEALRININDRVGQNTILIETRKKRGRAAAAPLLEAPDFRKLTNLIESQLIDLRTKEKQNQLAVNESIGNNNLQTLGAIWIMMMAAFLILLSMLFILNRYVVETREAERKLAEREARMRAIVDTAPDGILTFSDQGEIESANEATHKMFGYAAGELLGMQVIAIMENILPESRPHTSSTFGEKQTVGTGEEIRGRRKDGSTFAVEAALSVLNLGDRRIYTGIVRDITARKEAERRVSEFYSTVSHELRTPLTSIRTALGLMTSGAVGELSQKGGHLVRIAGGECDRLIRLINDILDFRKIEAGRLMLKPQLTNPQSLVDTTFQAIKGLAEEAGVELSKSIEFNEALHCDPDRIVQVLTNLISNAIKFSERGKEVRIRVTETESGRARFAIIDQGPGIREDQMSKLFAKFQQLDSSDTRKKGGTGLGLAISKAIVSQHGGEIGVETTAGKGSTFWFELSTGDVLPLAPDETLTLHRLRVMLVADDERLAEPLKELLQKSGFDLLRAATLAQAERIVEKTFPDIVLVDVELADGSGLEIVKHAGGALLSHAVPMIILGGWNEETGTIANPVLLDLQKNPFDCLRLRRIGKQAGVVAAESRVLVIEGDSAKANLLKTEIKRGGFQVIDEIDQSVSGMMRELEPDIIVLDLSVSNERCFEVLAGLRQGEEHSLPLVVYSEDGIATADINKMTLGLTRHLKGAGISTDEFCESVNRLMQGIVMTSTESQRPLEIPNSQEVLS
ncbi:MAG: PAS domain S-box protein [Candidatus Melainabacteria bacterium]|jgi:PAS domain S-box-containing protein|nr:PAS domain S-box protein [Candidatus Melainabacteria bacterium]